MKQPQQPNWLTLQEVALELGVPYESVRKWRQRGKLPHTIKLPNGQLRIHRKDLDLWLEGRAA